MQQLVTAVGVVLLTIGMAGAAPVIGNLVDQSQGKCDYLPCVWPWTLPVLAAYGALVAIGAILFTWSLLRLRFHHKS